MDRSANGRVVDAQLHLLDRQMLDTEGEPVMVVDDLELDGVKPDHDRALAGRPVLTRLLSGPTLWTRIFGGRPPRSRLDGIDWREVTDVGVVISVTGRAEDYDLTWRERWLRNRVITRIPGGRHAPE
ncbi:hypothetical protein [Curtobacterium sp. MCSS17_008]|uniref:hypothetical protein n=1 Tax=Curtobacterium sp. MCSS17_008 TaxID=2175647 RepID=UPI0021ACE63C|nr:hypothetical protein [Curtobacterium sp. MCSS17_008]